MAAPPTAVPVMGVGLAAIGVDAFQRLRSFMVPSSNWRSVLTSSSWTSVSFAIAVDGVLLGTGGRL